MVSVVTMPMPAMPAMPSMPLVTLVRAMVVVVFTGVFVSDSQGIVNHVLESAPGSRSAAGRRRGTMSVRDNDEGQWRMRWVLTVLGVVAVIGAMAFFGQRNMIFFPDRSDPGPAARVLSGGTDVTLRTGDGLDLSAWRIDPRGRNRDQAVVYLPGNGGNRAGRATVGEALAEQGFTVLLVDYRGYGANPGAPSEQGLLKDAQAAVAYLREAGFGPERTIYVGESIGTGVAAQLAVTDPPAAVLLRSPYTSLADVARAAYGIPLGWALRDRFDTLSEMPHLTCPVTVLSGAADAIIPPPQSRAIADAAPALHEHLELPGVGHNDSVWFGPFLAERVADLVDSGQL